MMSSISMSKSVFQPVNAGLVLTLSAYKMVCLATHGMSYITWQWQALKVQRSQVKPEGHATHTEQKRHNSAPSGRSETALSQLM